MGFVANGNNIPSNVTLTSGDFWPVINLNDLKDDLRLDGSITEIRLKNAAMYSIIDTNKMLVSLMGQAATLADLGTAKINGVPVSVILYRQAVAAGTGAKLAEKFVSYDSSREGEKRGEEVYKSADDYRCDQRWAIRDLLGIPHVTVELI